MYLAFILFLDKTGLSTSFQLQSNGHLFTYAMAIRDFIIFYYKDEESPDLSLRSPILK